VKARGKCKKNLKSIFVPFLFSLPLGHVPSFGSDLKCVFTPPDSRKYKVAITEQKQIRLLFVCLFLFLVSDIEYTQTRELLMTKGIKSGESVFMDMSGYLPGIESVV
jgi:hypothetical protein